MDRLTNNSRGNIYPVFPAEEPIPCSTFCTNCGKADCDYIRKCLKQLSAYEDTGLTPEQCAEYARAEKEGRYIVLKEPERDGVHRLQEIAQADAEGRLIVPTCKPGDTVYETNGERIFESTVIFATVFPGGKIVFNNGHIAFDDDAIGSSIFLTREEAEKAMEAGS